MPSAWGGAGARRGGRGGGTDRAGRDAREWVKRAVDEWALISKVDQAEHEVEETTKVANAKKAALAVKKELDQQVLEKKARKVRLKEDEVEYYHQEQAQLAKWREEEKAKVNKKREAALALKKERDAQLVELKIREEKALNKKKLEEEEQKRKVLADHKEKRRQEQEHRENMREEMKRLQASNIEARKIRQAIKDEDTALQLKYQEDYAKMLEAEEQKRADALKVFKAKQDRQEALGGVIGEYKRWIDPKIIEQNFKKNEAALDKEDKRRKDAVIKLNQEVKATLDRQMQEKEDIQAALDEQERKRVTAFMAKLELEKQKEREKDQASLEKRLAHKKSLQEQINARADAKRLRKGDMSGTERKMNAHMLAKAASTPGIKSK